jgi:hypothetical protein
MSDERRRGRARASASTGAFADEVAHLRDRVRAGELDEARLRWAAACGHEAAALAAAGAPIPADLAALHAELTGAPEAEVRFWLAVIRAVWSVLGDDRVVAELWCAERDLLGLPSPSLVTLAYATRTSDRLLAPWELLGRARRRQHGESVSEPLPAYMRQTGADALEWILSDVPVDGLRAQLLADWAPWLLGEGDPVAARVAAVVDPPSGEGYEFQPGVLDV